MIDVCLDASELIGHFADSAFSRTVLSASHRATQSPHCHRQPSVYVPCARLMHRVTITYQDRFGPKPTVHTTLAGTAVPIIATPDALTAPIACTASARLSDTVAKATATPPAVPHQVHETNDGARNVVLVVEEEDLIDDYDNGSNHSSSQDDGDGDSSDADEDGSVDNTDAKPDEQETGTAHSSWAHDTRKPVPAALGAAKQAVVGSVGAHTLTPYDTAMQNFLLGRTVIVAPPLLMHMLAKYTSAQAYHRNRKQHINCIW